MRSPGKIWLGFGAEEGDLLGVAVFGEREVGGGEAVDGVALFIGDLDGYLLEVRGGFELRGGGQGGEE
jgi:hypothetical protein